MFGITPAIQNPTTVGPPTLEGLPAGIVYDGDKFLVYVVK